jgi:response regulator RpfG family c-di-GMP phosphodiesterase
VRLEPEPVPDHQALPRLAMALGLTAAEAQMVSIAGRLHDVGKVAVSDSILRKPRPLTA